MFQSSKFIHDKLESDHGNCTKDYLEIVYGGIGEYDADKYEQYCGPDLPSPMISSENQMLIKFKTDGSKIRQGFEGFYQIGTTGLSCF